MKLTLELTSLELVQPISFAIFFKKKLMVLNGSKNQTRPRSLKPRPS